MRFIDDKRLLALSLGSAVAAGVAGWMFLQRLERTYQATTETMVVLTARRYIPKGSLLRADLFEAITVPKAYAQPEALTRFDVFESSPGRPRFRCLLPILAGAHLVKRDLAPIDQGDTLSYSIPENQVAVSFGVEAVRAAAGNLRPGDLIDILRTPKEIEGSAAPRATATLFQAVPLLAVGKNWQGALLPAENKEKAFFPEGAEDEPLILTVLLNPLAAVRLAQAGETEILSVLLRSPGDVRILEGQP